MGFLRPRLRHESSPRPFALLVATSPFPRPPPAWYKQESSEDTLMATSVQIQRVSVRHDAIMNFLLVNPTVPLGIVAKEFGVTQAWLSTIIHSDAFQAQLSRKKNEMFGTHVLPLGEKLLGLAHVAVEKMGQHLERTDDPDYVVGVATAVLDRIGYSPKAQPAAAVNVQQNNYYQVDKATLEEARSAIGRRLGVTLEGSLEATPAE